MTGPDAIDPRLLEFPAGSRWQPTAPGFVPDETELADYDTNFSFPPLPEVGTYIPIVDGPVRPEILLPENHPFPLTETAQLALDLSQHDGSMGWLDDIFELPLNHPYWRNMSPTQPHPNATLPPNTPITEPFWTHPSYAEHAYQPANPYEGLDLSEESDVVEGQRRQSTTANIGGGNQNTPQGQFNAEELDPEQRRKERKRQTDRNCRARKKQEREQGRDQGPRLLKKDDPEHQAMMRERKRVAAKTRRDLKRAEREATKAGLAEAAGHPEASTRKAAKARADKRKQDLPGDSTTTPSPASEANESTASSESSDLYHGPADAGDKKDVEEEGEDFKEKVSGRL